MCHFTATAYDPSGGDTIDSPSSDEDNHPVAPTTTDSSLNKISKAKGEQRKRKEKGMGMVGKILRMAHLQSILKNVMHQTIQFGHYHWTLSLVMIIALYGMSKKVKLKSGNDEDPMSLHNREVSPVKKASKTKSLKTPEGEGHAPKKGKKGKNESDNVKETMVMWKLQRKSHLRSLSMLILPLVLSEKVQRSKVGTLEGFSFFSEDETDKITKATAHQTDQNMDVEEPSNGKIKRKAEKSSGVARKKGKTAGGKPCNRMRRRNSSGRGWSMFEEENSFIVSPLPGLGIMVAACAPSGVFILCQRSIGNTFL
ncbi:hypothetical protein NC653_034114 [Populus alba x Populus x berolinensis]|uniref:Uncharacterized protein n=1 Tax=Populus alba x Populus x berolinensis TaxID=444605 RepID=A0AAD6PVN6_9ROSI|nr:hypothetical protein NC653_034114 [Populus alba x Populus x berolinensis]